MRPTTKLAVAIASALTLQALSSAALDKKVPWASANKGVAPTTTSAAAAPAASTPAAAGAQPSAAASAKPANPATQLQSMQARRAKHRKEAQANLKAWNDSRPQRAETHRQELLQLWGSLMQKPEAIAELRLHADRMARLNRALDLAEHRHDKALAAQVKKLTEREVIRDANALNAMKAGAP
jgi:hypothetical protein